MTTLPKPEIIFTHESDLDGFVAGLLLQRLAKHLFQTDIRLEAHHYTAWKLRDLREKSAWVTDLSFESRLDRSHWLVVDHHQTSVTPNYATLIHDPSKSAGQLAYDLCVEHGLGSPRLERLVRLNNISDLFLQDEPDFQEAVDYSGLVKIYGFWNLYNVVGGELENLLDHPLLEVIQVKRRVEDPLGYAWASTHVTEISPTIGLVDTIVGNGNLIVHQLLDRKATPYKVLVTALKKSNNQIVLSFRSVDGEALSVAEKFQGGGHPNAAGCTLPKTVRSVSDAVDYLRSVLNPKPTGMESTSMLNDLLEAFEAKP